MNRPLTVLLLSLSTPTTWAQSADSLCCAAGAGPTPLAATQPAGLRHSWILTTQAGVGWQYQRDQPDRSLFLSPGLNLNVAADYYVGRRLGVGLQAGYQDFGVRSDYVLLFANDAPGVTTPGGTETVGLLPRTRLHSFHLLAGPVWTAALTRRLRASVAARGGLFYNDAPFVGAFDRASGRTIFRLSASNERARAGLMGGLVLHYALNHKLSVGAGLSGFYTTMGYTIDRPGGEFFQFRRQLGSYAVSVAVAFRFRSRPANVPAAVLPTCYVPVLNPATPTLFDVDGPERPQFAWHSGAPVYADDERYTFRLYALPTNRLLYERTTTERALPWPETLKRPDSTSQFYYTVQASRRDAWEQTCLSDVATGALRFAKRLPAPTTRADEAPLTVDIFELRATPVATTLVATRRPAQRSSGRSDPQRRGQPRSGAVRATTRARTGAAAGTPAPTTWQEVLIYRELTRRREVAWPVGMPYPARPTLFRYVVRQDNRAPVGDYTLLVSADGSLRTLTPTERDAWLKTNVVK